MIGPIVLLVESHEKKKNNDPQSFQLLSIQSKFISNQFIVIQRNCLLIPMQQMGACNKPNVIQIKSYTIKLY